MTIEERKAENRVLVRGLLVLGAPIALQNLIGASLNVLDSVMIGQLGTPQIAGVALANQIFFLLNLFILGVGSGSAVFTAQYWGSRDIAGIRRSLGACLSVNAAGSLLFFGLSQAFPRGLIALFSADPAVIDYGARFLRIVSVGFLFQAVSNSYVLVLRSVERTRMALVASAISLAVNTLLNWTLVFGNLGMPALGVEGSGIATATARLIEMAIVLAAVYSHRRGSERSPAAARLSELFAFDLRFLKRYFAVLLPVVGNEVGWALGVVLEAGVFSRMSTDAIAAYNIADTAIKLVIVVFFGTTATNAVIVGKRIGEKDQEGAVFAARFYSILAPFLGAAMGLLLVGLSPLLPPLFNVSGQVRGWASTTMILYGMIMPLRMFNWHVIAGTLRAGADTRVGMIIDVGGTWLVSLPLTAVVGLLLGAPYWVVYLCTLTEDLPKLVLGVWRMRSRKWLNDLTHT